MSEYYQRFRRGYPPEVADELATVFALTRDDVLLDLGCGAGRRSPSAPGRPWSRPDRSGNGSGCGS